MSGKFLRHWIVRFLAFGHPSLTHWVILDPSLLRKRTGLLTLSVPEVLHFLRQVQLHVVITTTFFELTRDLFLVSLVLQIHSQFLETKLVPQRWQTLLSLTVSLI